MSAHDRRPLDALLISTIVSLIGSQFTLIALPWFVLTTTGSASRAGLVGFASLLPALAAGIFGGVFIDRLGFRRVAIAADLVSGLGILAIPVLYAVIGMQFWQLLLFVFIGSLLKIPSLTAHRSMVPELAARAGVPLDKANARFESLQSLAVLLGTPLAGLLISQVGARNVLLIDAASFALSALLVALHIPASLFAPRSPASASYLTDVMEGLRFIRRDQLLWPMVILLAATNATVSGITGLILPVYVKDTFGSANSLGLMVAAIGAGTFLGSTLYGMFADRLPRRLFWCGGFMLMTLEFWVFTLSPGIALIVAAFFATGIVVGPINPLMVTIRHERSPEHLRGRVFSTYSAVAGAAAPLGILLLGVSTEQIGFQPTIVAVAVCGQLIGVLALLIPAFRQMDALRHTSQPVLPGPPHTTAPAPRLSTEDS
jgi:MFS family permease